VNKHLVVLLEINRVGRTKVGNNILAGHAKGQGQLPPLEVETGQGLDRDGLAIVLKAGILVNIHQGGPADLHKAFSLVENDLLANRSGPVRKLQWEWG